jgi:hypothetical protein
VDGSRPAAGWREDGRAATLISGEPQPAVPIPVRSLDRSAGRPANVASNYRLREPFAALRAPASFGIFEAFDSMDFGGL